jgi:hypothetical protein
MKDQAFLAIKGLPGWTVYGRCSYGVYHCGPYTDADLPKGIPYRVDMTQEYEKDGIGASVSKIWKRPNLNLALPDGNVRCLMEGCIGCEGTTDGHAWDGSLASLQSLDSVGLAVYLEILRAAGGKFLD